MTGGQVAVRGLSVLLAAGLIVGALAFRDRDDVGGGGGDGDVTVEAGVVWCARELRICDDLEDALGSEVEVVADDGVAQFDELASTDQAPTAWVTLSSLADMTRQRRDREGRPALLAGDQEVGRTPLVLVGVGDRLSALASSCSDGVAWSCIGEAAGDAWTDHGGQASWGRVRPAHEALDESGVALLVVGQAIASEAEADALSTRVYDQVALWFSDLEQAISTFAPIGDSQLLQMLQQPGTVDVTGTTAAEAADVLTVAGTRAAALTVLPATPAVAARATVVAPVGEGVPDDLADVVADLLSAAGWQTASGPPAVTLDPPIIASDDALTFDGGALEALLLRWDQVR